MPLNLSRFAQLFSRAKENSNCNLLLCVFFAALLQVHPVRALRHPHQLLPVNHFIQRPHLDWTDADAEQGETPSNRRADSVFVPAWDFPLQTFFPSSLLPPLGLVHPDRRIPTLLLPVLLLLGPDGGLAVLHGRHGPPQESHHTQALPVSWLGCVILFQTRLPNC